VFDPSHKWHEMRSANQSPHKKQRFHVGAMHDDLGGTAEEPQLTVTPSAVTECPLLDGIPELEKKLADEINKRKRVPPIAVFLHTSFLPLPAYHVPLPSLPSR